MMNSKKPFTTPKNEKVLSYTYNSDERKAVIAEYQQMFHHKIEIPMRIGSEELFTKSVKNISLPHNHKHVIASYATATAQTIKNTIAITLKSREKWAKTDFKERATIFLKAANLFSGKYRSKIVAATMIGQSKNIQQSETDAACQLIDYLRFNVKYMLDIYDQQPTSTETVENSMKYRPLEGFVYAISPFNFTSIACNLWAAPVLLGNVCIWKPSDYQIYSAHIIANVFKEAGLPDGVLNMVFGDPEIISTTVIKNEHFAGLHFTGSTFIFKKLWKQIGLHIEQYKSFPKVIGETGGKGFIWADNTANPEVVTAAICRGSFEFQGQKCSAASRCYIPKSFWHKIKPLLEKDITSMKIGTPDDTSNFINAVIHENAFDRIVTYIEEAKSNPNTTILFGGNYNKSEGYFIEPTIILTTDPRCKSMREEIFGPIVTIYLYEDKKWQESLQLVDKTSIYGLTGAIFSTSKKNITYAMDILENAAGNVYINDKPTGGVIGQQPFGGSRGSGTNDKAGSILNLLRWVSPKTIKKVHLPVTDYKYPFLKKETSNYGK